jgi:hypothetical protein
LKQNQLFHPIMLQNRSWQTWLAWLVFQVGLAFLLFYPVYTGADNGDRSLCVSRMLTDIPCPGCGMGRGLFLLLRGHVSEAAWMNPFVFPVSALFVWLYGLLWLDVLRGGNRARIAFDRFQRFLQRRPVFWVLVVLLLANWIWNIDKFIAD